MGNGAPYQRKDSDMASEKQIKANRRNSQKSTGPKSPEGKNRSSRNALTHGLTADQVVLPCESVGAFEELREGLACELDPETVFQRLVFDRIVVSFWRLRRVFHFERELFRLERLQQELNHYRSWAEGGLPIVNDREPATIAVKESEPDWEPDEPERMYLLSKEEFASNPPLDGMVIEKLLRQKDVTEKLSRYERSIRRCLLEDLDQYRSLKEQDDKFS